MYCPCHVCHIYGIWRSKEVGEALKLTFRGGNANHKGGGGDFDEEGEVPTM